MSIVAAPHTKDGHRLVPPVGHLAGIYARVDIERGVHKAPASEIVRRIVTRDPARDVAPLEFTIGRHEQDLLNPRGVNVIHIHERDSVEVFFDPGTIRYRTADGKEATKTFKRKDARFIPRGTIDTEEAVSGSPRAVIVELK